MSQPEFLRAAVEYARSLPTPSEEAFAISYTAHLIGGVEPAEPPVRESRAATIRAVLLQLREASTRR